MDLSTPALFPVHALPPRFVLLVGEALRPAPEVVAEMAQDGLRCLWRANGEQALRTAAIAHFDAACLDSAELGGPSAWALTRLREALSCPIAVIGNGVDAQEELSALDHGADLYLARPLPPRRLCAHLLALLRRPRGQAPHGSSMVPSREPGLRRGHALLEQLLKAAAEPAAHRQIERAEALQGEGDSERYDVYIQGVHLRLR